VNVLLADSDLSNCSPEPVLCECCLEFPAGRQGSVVDLRQWTPPNHCGGADANVVGFQSGSARSCASTTVTQGRVPCAAKRTSDVSSHQADTASNPSRWCFVLSPITISMALAQFRKLKAERLSRRCCILRDIFRWIEQRYCEPQIVYRRCGRIDR
jgi:hypothetical protein